MPRPKQKGVAIVELAIVLPLLLLLFLAAAEVGRGLFQYNTLLKTVRDGARYMARNAFLGTSTTVDPAAKTAARNLIVYGAVGKTTCDQNDAVYAACDDLDQPPLSPFELANVDPIQNPTLLNGDYYVTVSATYNFSFIPGNPLGGIMGWFGGTLANTIPLTATITMRVLTP